MQQILHLAYFSFIAAIIIFDKFPKFAVPNEMHGAVLLEVVKVTQMKLTYLTLLMRLEVKAKDQIHW